METIYISKKRNGYVVELSFGIGEEETYVYKTKEEMVAALPGLIDREEELFAQYRAEKEAKQAARK